MSSMIVISMVSILTSLSSADKKKQAEGRGHESDDSDRPKKKAPAKGGKSKR